MHDAEEASRGRVPASGAVLVGDVEGYKRCGGWRESSYETAWDYIMGVCKGAGGVESGGCLILDIL